MVKENEMQELAEALWVYMKPKVTELLSGKMGMTRATITVAPNSTTKTVTVQTPFSDPIEVPFAPSLGSAQVGDSVWIASPHDNGLSNAVALASGDFSNL